MDIDQLIASLDHPALWLLLAATFVLGAIGALAHRATQSGATPAEPPRQRPINDALVGGIAAIAILYVTNPTTGVAFVGGSLVAGYAGKAVLVGLESRAVAALARDAAIRSRETAAATRTDLEQLADRVNALPADAISLGDVQRFASHVKAKHAT